MRIFELQCCNVQYFHTQAQLNSHYEQVHKESEGKKKFRCPNCPRRTDTFKALKSHVDQRHGVKNKPCSKCKKSFSSLNALRLHMKSHEAPKICQHCNRTIVHLSPHQKESKCKKCLQSFLCVHSAKMHRKMCKLNTSKSLNLEMS